MKTEGARLGLRSILALPLAALLLAGCTNKDHPAPPAAAAPNDLLFPPDGVFIDTRNDGPVTSQIGGDNVGRVQLAALINALEI